MATSIRLSGSQLVDDSGNAVSLGDIIGGTATALTAATAPAAAITGGEAPTEAEFNALRAVVDNHATVINAIITLLEGEEVVAAN